MQIFLKYIFKLSFKVIKHFILLPRDGVFYFSHTQTPGMFGKDDTHRTKNNIAQRRDSSINPS